MNILTSFYVHPILALFKVFSVHLRWPHIPRFLSSKSAPKSASLLFPEILNQFEPFNHMNRFRLFPQLFRDPPEPTGEEGEDADLDAPKVYEPVRKCN